MLGRMVNWYKTVKVPAFTRALWVVGPTASGKTTISTEWGAVLDCPLVECGQWSRQLIDSKDVVSITVASLEKLDKDLRFFSKKIGAEIALHKQCIVVGSRNPTDFVDNFVPSTDAVVFINTAMLHGPTSFEVTGIRTIMQYVTFLNATCLIKDDHIVFAAPDKEPNWLEKD